MLVVKNEDEARKMASNKVAYCRSWGVLASRIKVDWRRVDGAYLPEFLVWANGVLVLHVAYRETTACS